MQLTYVPLPHLDTIYTRMLQRVPAGDFYHINNLTIPFQADQTIFKIAIDADSIGKRHVLRSDLGNAKTVFVPDSEETDVGIFLDEGFQKVSAEFVDTGEKPLDSTTLIINVSNFGTLNYALTLNIVKQWADVLNFWYYVTSGYHMLTFESSISDEIRDLLPKFKPNYFLALKNLVRVKVSNSTVESITSFTTAISDMNPAKIVRHFNGTELTHERSEYNITENSTQDIHMWSSSHALGRRAVLNRLAHNFPERYSFLEALDEGQIRGRTEFPED